MKLTKDKKRRYDLLALMASEKFSSLELNLFFKKIKVLNVKAHRFFENPNEMYSFYQSCIRHLFGVYRLLNGDHKNNNKLFEEFVSELTNLVKQDDQFYTDALKTTLETPPVNNEDMVYVYKVVGNSKILLNKKQLGWLKTPIKSVNLPTRVQNCLCNHLGLIYIHEVVQRSSAEMFSIPNFGYFCFQVLTQFLTECDLELGMTLVGIDNILEDDVCMDAYC